MIGTFRLPRLHLTRIEAHGVSLDDVMRAAGLPASWLREERLVLSTEQLFAFWTAVGQASTDPLVGLRLGRHDQAQSYDPICLAALSASTFRDAIERAGRYKQITCPEDIRVVDAGRESRVQFRWLLTRDKAPVVLQDLCFAWIHMLGELGTGHALVPVRVELSRPPAHRAGYTSHFKCPVRFNAAADSLVFDRADLDRPFRTRNPDLLAMIAPQLEAELADRQTATSLADRVKATVKRLLAGRRPDLGDVARELGVSTRTLQRRLTGQGVTYQQMLEDARRDLAHHYLLHSALDLSETAYLLGYEDASSFFRAFNQWEGSSPGRWRARRRTQTPPVDATRAAGRPRPRRSHGAGRVSAWSTRRPGRSSI
jgi:AraC-like DNA-binding protein